MTLRSSPCHRPQGTRPGYVAQVLVRGYPWRSLRFEREGWISVCK